MNNLISWNFWFNGWPEPINHLGLQIIAGLCLLLFVIALIIHLEAYPQRWSIYKPSLKRLLPFCFTNILIAFYIVFINDQVIPILRARAWYIVWLIIAIIWLVVIIKKAISRLKKKETLAKEAEIKKYIP